MHSIHNNRTEISLQQVDKHLERAGVPMPLVPKDLCNSLHPWSDLAFGSMPTSLPLYNLDRWLEQLQQGWPEDYFGFGIDGHGINSRAAHYYLLTERCALFIQRVMPLLPSPSFDGNSFTALMNQAAELSCDPMLDNTHGRLIVVDSDIQPSGLGWWHNNTIDRWQPIKNGLTFARTSL